MFDTISIDPTLASEKESLDKYRSRPKQLASWLLESRKALRDKYQTLKSEAKRLKVRLHDLAKSRDSWRQRAEISDQQVLAIQADVERLTKLLEQTTVGEAFDSLKKRRLTQFADYAPSRRVHCRTARRLEADSIAGLDHPARAAH